MPFHTPPHIKNHILPCYFWSWQDSVLTWYAYVFGKPVYDHISIVLFLTYPITPDNHAGDMMFHRHILFMTIFQQILESNAWYDSIITLYEIAVFFLPVGMLPWLHTNLIIYSVCNIAFPVQNSITKHRYIIQE